MSQKLPVDCFKWKRNMLKFIKSYDEDSDKGYILEVKVEYPKKYVNYIIICHFCLKE